MAYTTSTTSQQSCLACRISLFDSDVDCHSYQMYAIKRTNKVRCVLCEFCGEKDILGNTAYYALRNVHDLNAHLVLPKLSGVEQNMYSHFPLSCRRLAEIHMHKDGDCPFWLGQQFCAEH